MTLLPIHIIAGFIGLVSGAVALLLERERSYIAKAG